MDNQSKSGVNNEEKEQIHKPEEERVVLLPQTGAQPGTVVVQMLDTVVTHLAVRCSHGSVELTRIAELEFELSASENNVEELLALLVCDLNWNFSILFALELARLTLKFGKYPGSEKTVKIRKTFVRRARLYCTIPTITWLLRESSYFDATLTIMGKQAM